MDTNTQLVIIGNGESRQSIKLDCLSKYITVGCNALHRDIVVDHLVCIDHSMIVEAVNSKNIPGKLYIRPEYFFTYRKLKKLNYIAQLPDIPYTPTIRADYSEHWGSGIYALLIGALNTNSTAYIVGFDLYGVSHRVNNIYKDTLNYSTANTQPVDPSYWIYQASKIFQHFSSIQFIVVNQHGWKIPQQWNLSNVSFMTIDEFLAL